MALLYAHTDANGSLEHGQLLEDHVRAVARQARDFAQPVGAGMWAYAAGLAHDAGKASDAFQRRLRGDPRHVDHSTGGAQLVAERYDSVGRLLAFAIAGHHGGMPNWRAGTTTLCGDGKQGRPILKTPLNQRLSETVEPFRGSFEHVVTLPAPGELVALSSLPNCLVNTAIASYEERAFGLYLTEQMIFSSLVDADYLDTESIMSPEQASSRTSHPVTLADLAPLLDRHLAELAERAGGTTGASRPSPVNRVRAEVLRQCEAAAENPPGMFTLEVPTGGGKTLSSLSFAVRHALRNGQRRIIIAIPYTSIVEQTAATLKAIFGPDNVLEHHSNYDFERAARARTPADDDTEAEGDRALRERLLVQNWDAPIIVTTNVQLFESLFANKPSRCRKVHNVADAVVILDEVQTLPDGLLRPTLAMIQALCDYAHTTVVLSTATQPAFDDGCWPFPSRPRAIVRDDDGELFAPLMGRVSYETDRVGEDALSLDELADLIAGEERVLCVVSSQGAARWVYEAVRDRLGSADGLFHLSGLMIPEHRSRSIGEIRGRLADGESPCRVVSTQLIEAGVDVDFPMVLREAAGIDSIIQAAGRCNREGRLEGAGRVVVFECPEMGRRSEGSARRTRGWLDQMRALGLEVMREAREREFDAFGRKGVWRFFSQRYKNGQGGQRDALDSTGIFRDIVGKEGDENGQGKRGAANDGTFSFEAYAASYRFIEDDGVPLFVPWGERGRALLERIETGEVSADLYRALQRFVVAVPVWAFRGEYAQHVRAIGPFNVLEDRTGSERLYSEELGLLRADEGELDLLVV